MKRAIAVCLVALACTVFFIGTALAAETYVQSQSTGQWFAVVTNESGSIVGVYAYDPATGTKAEDNLGEEALANAGITVDVASDGTVSVVSGGVASATPPGPDGGAVGGGPGGGPGLPGTLGYGVGLGGTGGSGQPPVPSPPHPASPI